MLEDFKELQSAIIDEISRIKGTGFLRHNRSVEELEDIEKKLLENRFHLVVLGQFKRGKSTFINSIIGEKLLPTSVVPLTSIVTVLKYGDREGIRITLNDNTVREIGRDELADWITEEGNPKNEKDVKEVEIFYPSDYLRDGICLIDTPGVGSIFENNTEMTYKYLTKIDAGIFLLSADPPISHSEMNFLKDVMKYVDKIFFILNKIDYLDEDDLNKSLTFTKKSIEENLAMEDVYIYPLSAKMALNAKMEGDQELLKKSRLDEFNRVLNRFLLDTKGQIVLKNAVKAIRRIISEEKLSLELEEKAISAPLEQLEDKIKKFHEKMKEITQDKEDTYYYFEGEIKRVIDILDRDLYRLKEREIPRLEEYVDSLSNEFRGLSVNEYTKAIESKIDDEIVKLFDRWIMEEEERLNQEYARVSKRFSDRTNEIIDAILDLSEDIFDVKIDRIRTEERIERDSSFYYMLGEPPKFFGVDSAVDFFSKRLLPARFSKNFALKDIKNKIAEKVDKTCGRVRWDFMDRIRRSFMNFRWDLNQKIDDTEKNITMAIEKAMELRKKSAEELEKAREDISKMLGEIEDVQKRLEKIESKLLSFGQPQD